MYRPAELWHWQMKEQGTAAALPPPPAKKRSSCSMVFTLKEMEEATNMFSERNLIGKGGFGRVYRGVLKDGQVSSFIFQQNSVQSFRLRTSELLINDKYIFDLSA